MFAKMLHQPEALTESWSPHVNMCQLKASHTSVSHSTKMYHHSRGGSGTLALPPHLPPPPQLVPLLPLQIVKSSVKGAGEESLHSSGESVAPSSVKFLFVMLVDRFAHHLWNK